MGRARAYIGLGANIGDAAETLVGAVHALAALPGVRLAGVSRLYATTPVGVLDQPEFRNAVTALDVPGGPDPVTGALALLIALKGLERSFGRRDGPRWGPRALDLDLLIFGRHAIRAERPSEARSEHPAPTGDPRRPGVDPIDWIERIPIEETRRYVAKVLSNIQIYRARLGEKEALRLDEDLARAREASRSTPKQAGGTDTADSRD